MYTIESKVKAALRCNNCKDKKLDCNENCEKYILYCKAYERAMNILENPTLGIPRWACKGCTERKPLCHSTCYDYLVSKAYRELVNERAQKEKNSRYNSTCFWYAGISDKS